MHSVRLTSSFPNAPFSTFHTKTISMRVHLALLSTAFSNEYALCALEHISENVRHGRRKRLDISALSNVVE